MHTPARTDDMNFRTLAESIPQIVWTASGDGVVDYFNQRWYEFTGLKADARQSLSWEALVHPDARECSVREWHESIAAGRPYQNERRFRRAADGVYRWHRGTAIPLRGEGGEVVRWFGTCTDIHDQKIAEAERTHAISQERIAREQSRLKTEFLATMSHEIRTPLNSVIGMTEILLDSTLDSDQYEYVDTIRNSAGVLLALINDVLDLSKVEVGRLTLETEDFDLLRLLRGVEQEHSWFAKTKDLRLSVAIADDVPTRVRGDAVRTRQVLNNLVANALKFTTAGHVKIGLSAVESRGGRTLVRFDVEDSGIGLAAEDLAKLFEPFVQIQSAMTRKYGGSGLGLSICQRLVKLMNGEIIVKSELGRGSTFSFTAEFDVVATLRETERDEEIVELRWTREPRLLVAEDMILNQKVITLFLRKLGCSAHIVENGLEVLDALDRESYDLVLMDCQMPELDGYDTTSIIRGRTGRGYRDIPIYAITANAISGDRERCLEVGMTGYLSKPIRFADFKKLLQNALAPLLKKGGGQDVEPQPKAAAEPSRTPSVDWNIIREIDLYTEGERSTSEEVVVLFRDNAFKRIEALRLAIAGRNANDIRREAHVFKSASSYIGALRISEICDEIRTHAESGEIAKVSQAFEALLSELGVVFSILDQKYPKTAS